MRFLREPLLHFLLLGAALFLLFDAVGRREEPAEEIVVTSARIDNLAASFARTWQRPPSVSELDALIDDFIREEVLYREALGLGLDRNDTVIRRRLRQKMEFIAEDLAAQEPADAQLESYLREHAADYRVGDRYTFRHIYLDAERRGDRLDTDAERLLTELNAGGDADPEDYGDPFLLPHTFAEHSEREISGAFGDGFVAALRRLPPRQWHGPIASSYGAHLVFIDQRAAGRSPELSEVRESVRRDWERQRRVELRERVYRELLSRYAIRIESTEPGSAPAAELEP